MNSWKLNLRLAVAIVLFALTSPGSAFGQEPAVEGDQAAPSKPVAVEDVVDDDAIQSRLQKILEARERYSGVTVHVENGVVTFEGTANSGEDRLWVEDLAERTEGVVVVDNQIEVESAINIEGNMEVIWKSLMTLWKDFLVRFPLIVAGIVVLILTALLAKLVGSVMTRVLANRKRLRSSLKDLLNQLATLGIWLTGLIVAAVIVFPGLTPAKALTVLGLGSVAIGFAFKDIFENFFAGVLILWRYPFDRGDFIQCDDIVGHVELITVRNTMLRRLDGELTVIPNAHLFKSKVDILTNRTSRRVRITCGVAYGENIARAREVIEQAVQSCPTVNTNRAVEVFAEEFADSSVNFEVAWWTGAKPIDIRASRDEVVESIKTALDDADIERRRSSAARSEAACSRPAASP